MTNAHIMDAAYPPSSVPDGADGIPKVTGVLGYLAAPRATHAWTVRQWLSFQHLAQFPAWVADLSQPAQAEGIAAVKAARALGWAADMPGAQNRVIVVDLEGGVNRAWYAEIADTIDAGGFTAVAYGSASTVLQNAASDVIIAEWVDSVMAPAIPAGQTLRGLQYDANVSFGGTQIDLSVFSPWLMARAGVGPRHG